MAYTPIIPATGVVGYNYLNRTRTEQQALFRAAPEIQRELETFSSQIQDVKSADELLDNYALLKVALGAFGLEEDISNRGFMKAVLESDPANESSFVNRLADKSYLEFAKAFNFAGSAGPQLDELKTVDAVKAQVEALASAEELVENGDLLRAALDTFGLGADQKNTHFLKLVLNSDLDDPASFANGLSDARYAQFAQSFGFGARLRAEADIFGFANTVSPVLGEIRNVDDLLAQPDVLSATAKFFGLDGDVSDTDFWTDVFESDLSDAGSFANTRDDPRYAAIVRAFELPSDSGDASQSKIGAFVEGIERRNTPYEDVSDFFGDFNVLLGALDVLDLPRAGRSVQYAGRVLESDVNDPTSLINLEPDPRYAALQTALNFQPIETGHTYPDGFSDAIAQRYVDHQFEVQIGTQDPSMRVALSFDRDLEEVVISGTSENSRWFAVMASGPLRSVFETIFNLPSAFGTLDIDQQLTVFKDRSESRFGVSDVAQMNTEALREEIRNEYLLRSDANIQGVGSSGNLVLALLAG